MLSMGGKSMQIASGESLFSLPFAMHIGAEALMLSSSKSWREKLGGVEVLYRDLAKRALEEQADLTSAAPLEGEFVGVTDTVEPARELGIADRLLGKQELLGIFTARVEELARQDCPANKAELVHAARVLALQAVVAALFKDSASFNFRTDIEVNWTNGYFLWQGAFS